jgi:hypothetical protein
MDEPTEQWKEVAGFPSYSVSDQGRVYNHNRGVYLKFERTTKGYHKVILLHHGVSKFKYVHDLVAVAYLGMQDNQEVKHKDGNRMNCKVSNLELVPKGTIQDSIYKLGLESYSGVRVLETGQVFRSVAECAKTLKISERAIQVCLDGGASTSHGFHFVRAK